MERNRCTVSQCDVHCEWVAGLETGLRVSVFGRLASGCVTGRNFMLMTHSHETRTRNLHKFLAQLSCIKFLYKELSHQTQPNSQTSEFGSCLQVPWTQNRAVFCLAQETGTKNLCKKPCHTCKFHEILVQVSWPFVVSITSGCNAAVLSVGYVRRGRHVPAWLRLWQTLPSSICSSNSPTRKCFLSRAEFVDLWWWW